MAQVHETPELYASVVKPYLESLPPSRIQWVYNILTKQVGGSCMVVAAGMLAVQHHANARLCLPDALG